MRIPWCVLLQPEVFEDSIKYFKRHPRNPHFLASSGYLALLPEFLNQRCISHTETFQRAQHNLQRVAGFKIVSHDILDSKFRCSLLVSWTSRFQNARGSSWLQRLPSRPSRCRVRLPLPARSFARMLKSAPSVIVQDFEALSTSIKQT